MTSRILVRPIRRGYYEKIREAGSEPFAYPADWPLGSWMEKVDGQAPPPTKDEEIAALKAKLASLETAKPAQPEGLLILAEIEALDDEALRAYIARVVSPRPKGLHLMGREKMLALFAEEDD